ncbi:hypothetical protein ANCDUO_25051 [Ancylostoma duodenale]|uniref:Uncharacterized protein n=1 Tax=Ancylostoma duodenale TaxID=51022 RepID=A0A0C2FJA5_9BILA|nr:hypothetical protein ANCDUO_25051 [Ancylostoma duodenale]
MKTGRTQCFVPSYLRNSDTCSKKKDSIRQNVSHLIRRGRSAGRHPTVQQLLFAQPGPSRIESPCLEEHHLEGTTPQRICCEKNFEKGYTSDFSSKCGSARIRSTEHGKRLEQWSNPAGQSVDAATRTGTLYKRIFEVPTHVGSLFRPS